MKFRIKCCNVDAPEDSWWEEYDKRVDDAQEWAEATIAYYNDTLYAGDKPRKLLAVEVLDEKSNASHRWEKQNGMTVFKNGRTYDVMKCAFCGITGKRYGLSNITLDAKFRPKVYQRCDTSKAHRIKKGELNPEEPSDE